jgi:PKD repeat protein
MTRGQALVELALILPILLMFVAGAVDLGRVFYGQITVTNAAREGALEGAVNPTSWQAGQPCNKTSNRVMCRTQNEARNSFVTIAQSDVTMTCVPDCSAGTSGSPHTVVVSVRGHFTLLLPLLNLLVGGPNLTLTASASAMIAMAPTGGIAPTPTPSPSPSPTPTPTPTPSASASPTPTPTPTPTPAPPICSTPVASFTVTPASGQKNSTVFQFTDGSTNMSNPGCNAIWSWNFGDGSGVSSQPNPSYIYNKKGTYTVTLVVSNTAGTSAPFTQSINVTN